MSGGYFDYKQHHIDDIAEDIGRVIRENGRGTDPKWDYSRETISLFYEALEHLEVARTYAHRIDYLLCGDDSEESFRERLNEELNKP